MTNLSTAKNDEARPHVDAMLHDFFQAELPKQLPAFKVPFPAHRTASFWSRSASRLALAACVALLVAGYLALAGNFPGQQNSNGVEPVGGQIGKKDSKSTHHERPLPFVPVNK